MTDTVDTLWTVEAYEKMLEEGHKDDLPPPPRTDFLEVDKTFMSGGIEFVVTLFNDKNNTFSIQPIEGKDVPVRLGEVMNINGKIYDITYINYGQKRITIKLRIK